MITGVFWSTVQKYSGLVVQLVVSAVLARLIAPEDFGVVAVATVLIIFFSMFADMGGRDVIGFSQGQELINEKETWGRI